jgi:hypothetical protein
VNTYSTVLLSRNEWSLNVFFSAFVRQEMIRDLSVYVRRRTCRF